MIYLYITRHGMTLWNELGKLQGHSDSPLTKQGKEDAQRLSKVMEQYPIDIIYSSPLNRAYDTAKLIFPNREIIKDDRLKEMSFGNAEGRLIKELLNEKEYDNLWNHPELFDRFENGESYQEVYDRLIDFLNDIKQNNEQHVFITIHGMLYVVLMSIFKHLDRSELTKINRQIIRGGSLTIIKIDGLNYEIITEGNSDHLEPLKNTVSFIKK